MNSNTILLFLVSLPIVTAPIVYLCGRISIRKGQALGMSLARLFTLIVLLAEICLLVWSLHLALTLGSVASVVGAITLYFDGVGLIVSTVVLALGLMVTLFSFPYMANSKGEEKFYALLLITIASIIGLGLSFDLFNLWVWFEMMAISTFFLVAFYNDEAPALEAGMKYLVQSATGSALVLFGIAIVFSQTGSTSMADIWQMTTTSGPLLGIAGILMICGFGVKAALVPMHSWLPDAHSQAPSGISALLSGVVIEAGLIAMLRTISILGKIAIPWGAILLGFGCLNILVGNLMALRQHEVKRLLAFSSLAHVGYILLGFGFSLTYKNIEGATGGFFHFITHSLMKGLAFLAAGAFLYALHLSHQKHEPLTLDDLNGAARKYPIAAIGLSIAVLGLGGLPPLAGFMSKWQILVGGVASKEPLMIGIVVFAALNSILSLGYYAPIVNRLFRKESSTAVGAGNPIPALMVVPMVVLGVLIILLGVWPSLVNFITQQGANSLLYTFFS
jgi:proton-translocating NADH-quinone oxidoreductase chain N